MTRSRSFAVAAVCALLVVACTGSDTADLESSDSLSTTTVGGSAGDADAGDERDVERDAADTTSEVGDASDQADDSNTGGSNAGGARGSLDWAPCDEQPTLALGPALECATLTVPLDHGDTDGEAIEIAVARYDTAADADQIGSLVFNPGGPGGSGIDFVTVASAVIPAEVQDRFDLVGFDPRGVGASTALDCDIPIDDEVPIVLPDDDAAWAELLADTDDITELCTQRTLELGPYVGTNNAARDLDLLREALGDDGLSYVGYSYGTRLGATYAELFPDNVRALVLDAAVLPERDLVELGRGQAAGFDRALANFAAACDADSDCILQELGPTLEVIDGLRTEIRDLGEFPTDDPERVLTAGEFELGIVASLYSKDAWPFLAQGLFVADVQQDGTLLQVLGDGLQGRQPDGTYDNSNVANAFINCADDPARPGPDEVRASAEEVASISANFADVLRADTGCLGFSDAIDPLVIGPAVGAPPILVIGSTGDPATPFEWSEQLAAFLDSGVLYTVEAEGHTAYGTIDCVADDVNAYLIDLTVPAEPSCSDNASADFFEPVGESQAEILVELFACLRDNGLDIPQVTLADVLADPSGEVIGGYLDPNDDEFQAALLGCFDIVSRLDA